MYDTFTDFIKDKKRLSIIQAENPDGDSLGSALALDFLLKDHEISLYCPVDIPKYLHYMADWSRVSHDFDFNADGYIIVDTASNILLSKLLDDPAIHNRLISAPVFVLDHHETEDDLTFAHQGLVQTLPACCDLIYQIAREQKLLPAPSTVKARLTEISEQNLEVSADEVADLARYKAIATYLVYGIFSDTLGLTSANVTADTYRLCADLLDYGLDIAELEEKRREFMKKSQKILNYKADLIKKVEYWNDGTLATVHIPWEEIQEYSHEYNPSVLILEELRLVEGVEVAICYKTYPDGKITGKIRSSTPIADKLAGYFGGGGHPYAAGFRTYDLSYDDAIHETIEALEKLKTL
ncbi:DHH family phosphoesterase [Candidatus Saccharibacteria bacterium]|nr:DHH family phosphoesterase [Candidatus Saccharibacteria bacterium]